jgi:hypothetical protein
MLIESTGVVRGSGETSTMSTAGESSSWFLRPGVPPTSSAVQLFGSLP